MTKEQFASYTYRHSEVMILHNKHPEVDIEMLLLGVDFDNQVFKLIPIDVSLYEEEPIYVNYELVDKKIAWRVFQKKRK